MSLVQTEPKKICMFQPPRLPAEYQEVKYIETTGTQFIDTAVFPSNSIQVETDIEVTQTAQDKPVFGTYRIGTNNNDSISGYYHLTCYNSKWYYGLNGAEGNAGTYSPVAGTKYSIIYNNINTKLVVNNNGIATLTGTTGQSGCTLTISRRGWSSGSGNRYGQYKFYNFKMYDKSINEYVRDFVPCYRKADTVIGMYDLVNDQFYTNSGTGTFTKGNDVNLVEKEIKKIVIFPDGVTEKQIRPVGRLPSAYQEVEYIESSGTQYIDTGIADVNTNTRLEYSYTPMVNNNGLIFMDNGWASNGIGNGWSYYYYGDENSYSGHSYPSFPSNVIGTKYDFVLSNTECSRNGANIIVPGMSSLALIGTVVLFKNKRNGTIEGGASSKCHYYRRYDSGTLTQELVPCYRIADGVIGMYDIVNKNFLTNAGTGTFTKGPDVN